MANALAHETSPYLRQHAQNPVDWMPWGPEALARAAAENKPILVSIGYSACHWCHVMERESFEDPQTAAVMNARFVCVKVDREERPDVDAIYMEAVQGMTGRGGWPLNVFCTPEQVPFYGGTYFPPEPRHGMPAWTDVLRAISDAWETEEDDIRGKAGPMAARLGGAALLAPSPDPLDADTLEAALVGIRDGYDAINGGFGRAPKFPPSSVLELLLRRGETSMSLYTLRSMAGGGIHDQIGGGFSRYAVDGTWTVPHFEKMLYDNALLARAYLHGWQLSGDDGLRRVCEDILDFLLRELRGPEGAFLSALDADSEGVEGKFYVWTLDELRAALAPGDFDAAVAWLGASDRGNFDAEGELPPSNVLEDRGPAPEPEQRERIRRTLFDARAPRVRPGLDDKRLASWNALAIAAFAEAGAALGRPDYVDAARTAAAFVLDHMRTEDGRLLRTSDGTVARLPAYLEDHAYLLEALLTLYEATFEDRWFVEARALADLLLARFADPERGGFFSVADDHEQLVARRKDLEDQPIPAGASAASTGLLRLAALTGEHAYEEAALGTLRLVRPLLEQHPLAFGHLLQALDLHLATVREVALVGDADGVAALATVVRERLRPHVVVAARIDGAPSSVPLLEGREPVDGRAAAYVCEAFSCLRPVTEPAELRALLGD